MKGTRHLSLSLSLSAAEKFARIHRAALRHGGEDHHRRHHPRVSLSIDRYASTGFTPRALTFGSLLIDTKYSFLTHPRRARRRARPCAPRA